MAVAGWWDAADQDQSKMGKCRLGYVIRWTSSRPRGPCHIIQWSPKFTRMLIKNILGRDACAFSEKLNHMSVRPEFYQREDWRD